MSKKGRLEEIVGFFDAGMTSTDFRMVSRLEFEGLLPQELTARERDLILQGYANGVPTRLTQAPRPSDDELIGHLIGAGLEESAAEWTVACWTRLLEPARGVDGWELRLFADTLRTSLQVLEPSWVDFDMQVARPSGVAVDDPIEYLRSSVDRAGEIYMILGNIHLVQPALEPALGAPGEAGDRDRIVALAGLIIGIYQDAMQWAGAVRGAIVPSSCDDLRASLARLAVRPVRQLREAIERSVESIDSALDRGESDDGPIPISLTFEINIAEEDQAGLLRSIDLLAESAREVTDPGENGTGDLLQQVTAELGQTDAGSYSQRAAKEIGP